MTDHAHELRRYSRKIGHPAGDVPSVMLAAAEEIERLAARLEAAEKSDAESLTMYRKARDERDALRAKIEAAERERDECNRRRLEAADHFAAQAALMKKKYDALRAKIAEMEQQEPVAWRTFDGEGVYDFRSYEGNENYKLGWDARNPNHAGWVEPLYALPGAQAQPAPGAPDVWLPVPEKHPTFDPVDLQLSDGSVLCGCVPQADGDYWWEGPSGEVFIDPKYASVTHWRLAAAPEAKPCP